MSTKSRNFSQELSKNLSSPPKDLILGHAWQITRDIFKFIECCSQEYGDIVPLSFGALGRGFFLNHPVYIEEAYILKNEQFMRKGLGLFKIAKPLLGNGLFLSEGEFYSRQRQLAKPAVHKKMLPSYGKTMVEETQRFINTWKNGESRDVYQDYISITASIIAKTSFGHSLQPEETKDVSIALDATMEHQHLMLKKMFLIPNWFPLPKNLYYKKTLKNLDRVIYNIIEVRRNSGKNEGNYLDLLLQAQKEHNSRITEKQLRDEVVNLFLAGHETTAIVMAWTSYILSQNPQVDTKLSQELKTVLALREVTAEDIPNLPYTKAVILEALRLYPPVWLIGRTAMVDTEIGGVFIPKGSEIFACPWTTHRDERFFKDPGTFNPERWLDGLVERLPLGAYFPFSLGPRLCLGKAFGMMESILLLATIAQKFHFELVPSHPVELFPALTMRPKYGMKMIINYR